MKLRPILVLSLLSVGALPSVVWGQAEKPNILVIFGDDIGQTNELSRAEVTDSKTQKLAESLTN